MKFDYYLENSAGYAGLIIEIQNFNKNYSIAYGWDGCDIKDLLGGIIALFDDNSKLCSELSEKYLLQDSDNSFEWLIIAGPDQTKFNFLKLDEKNMEVKIFESDFNSNEDGENVFTGIVKINELIECILSSCNRVLNQYGILGYYNNFWVEFPLFYYLYLKNIIDKKIEYKDIIENINNEDQNMNKTNILEEIELIIKRE